MSTPANNPAATSPETIGTDGPITPFRQYKKVVAFRRLHRWVRELLLQEFVGHDGKPAARRIWCEYTHEWVPEEAIRAFALDFAVREETARVLMERLAREFEASTQ
jgi:hypothetical protein